MDSNPIIQENYKDIKENHRSYCASLVRELQVSSTSTYFLTVFFLFSTNPLSMGLIDPFFTPLFSNFLRDIYRWQIHGRRVTLFKINYKDLKEIGGSVFFCERKTKNFSNNLEFYLLICSNKYLAIE